MVDEALKGKVNFHPFVGVTPNDFRVVFQKGGRKDINDEARRWNASEVYPVFTTGYPSYLTTEANVLPGLEVLKNKMDATGNPLGLAEGAQPDQEVNS